MEKPGPELSGPAGEVSRRRTLRVWDLPTRLFHWLIAVLVAVSFTTATIGGNWMSYHVWCGEAILALLIFRIAWGFIGSTPSRFRSFLVGPAAVVRYASTLFSRDSPHYLTHNPLGGWSVAAMLMALSVQAVTGLFADDDIATQGPLAKWVSNAMSRRLTALHHLNHDIIIALVALHVAAVLFHLIYKKENLILPMITGIKTWSGDSAGEDPQQPLWRAAIAAAVAAGAVYFLVR